MPEPHLNDFSDRQMEHFARFEIITKWFIGIPIEDRYYDHSTLGDFRDRLGEKKMEKTVLLTFLRSNEYSYYSAKTYQSLLQHEILLKLSNINIL